MTDAQAIAEVEATINKMLDLVEDVFVCNMCEGNMDVRMCRDCGALACGNCRQDCSHGNGMETERCRF